MNHRIEKLNDQWEVIKELTGFQKDYSMMNNQSIIDYLSRPLLSRFLHSESIGINHFTSTYPLPITFKEYKHVTLKIKIDSSITNKLSDEDKVIIKKVSFYYLVDTIIKETLRTVLKCIECKIEEEKIRTVLKNTQMKFVLKLENFEEYFFGENPICTYETIRKKTREYESINLILKAIDKILFSPKLKHYPPLIFIPVDKKYHYNKLIKKYIRKFPEDSIVFRMKPKEKLKGIFHKCKMKRREILSKFCQSGECDFPFVINIKAISNFFSLKKHIDQPSYHENEVDLPFFQNLKPNKEENKKRMFFSQFISKICGVFNKPNKEHVSNKENENEHHINKELVLKNYQENLEKQEILNYLKKTKVKERTINFKDIFTYYYRKNIKEKIAKLQSKESGLYLENYKFPFNPVFIRIEILLMFGSYEINKLTGRFYIINNEIKINEHVKFPNLLISHLPRETRICINLYVFDSKKVENFVIACGQCPVFNENGYIDKNLHEIFLWPLYKIDCRTITMSQYTGKIIDNNNVKNEFNKRDYCIIYIEFPKFFKPFAHSLKDPQSYKEFLQIKYSSHDDIFSLYEIHNLYSNSIQDLEEIFNDFKERDQYFFNLKQMKEKTKHKARKSGKKNSEIRFSVFRQGNKKELFKEESSSNPNIWNMLNVSLDKVRYILSKDPLVPLEKGEREVIIFSRDYICTIPSALEVFLRSIDWFNPLQVNIAKIYIKKWEKIEPQDAISLLDSRYPSTFVREYAVSILSETSDDILNSYMLQLCQCLMYELYHLSPLADLIIEKCLKSPKIIGNAFFWNARVCMKNKVFLERLSVITTYIFMLSGPNFIKRMYTSSLLDKELKQIALEVKEKYNSNVQHKKEEAKILLRSKVIKLDKKRFEMPIHPMYYVEHFNSEKCSIFGSKMVPILLSCISKDGGDSSFNLIYKCGDDLRQDVLTLQILRIMDKMWLDSGLDLKITAYNALPTGIKEGFIEFVDANVIDFLQQQEGVSGALDRELLIKHLRSVNQTNELGTKLYDSNQQFDNFIRSLAGFCVATCVLGIGDRHPGNVMIKNNGIFFHIDYGHILGNFKYKFGIKRERAPFLLTPDMAHVYIKNQKEEEFKNLCVKAYIILRKNANRLINLYIIMSSAGLPELRGIQDVQYIKKMLMLDKNEEDAGTYFKGLINQSKNEKFRLLDNIIHNMKHG